MPLSIVIAIPQGEPGSIEIRPKPPNPLLIGPPLDLDAAICEVDAVDLMELTPEDLAARYAAPAFAILQNKLRKRGF